MQVSVSGKQIDIGSSLQEHVKDRLTRGVTKYFDRALHADVVFSKYSHLYRADILVNEGTGTGIIIKGNGESDEIYSSFDNALERIEKQLRRYKRKIKNHHKPKLTEIELSNAGLISGKKYVLSPVNEEQESGNESDDTPVIIAEKATAIETLTVSEAVMRMDLQQLPALLFRNHSTGRINVVYQRVDGNISWVDPESAA